MAAYVARRIVLIALVLLAVSMLVFAITTLLPANVAYLILGPFAPPEQVRALELKLGLTDPVWQQYLRWAGRFLSGDLGLIGRAHGDEREAARAAGHLVHGDVNVSHGAELAESGAEFVFGGLEGQVADV